MFRHKVPAIKVARDRLLDLPVEQARTGALVLGGLRRACELADTLDSCITEDMTFAKHFFNELATLPHDDESHWMNLLEDLALIFRAKRLAFPDLPEEGEERRPWSFSRHRKSGAILKRKWAHGTGNFSPNVCRVEPVHVRFRGRVGQEQLRAVALSRMISFLPSRRSARRKRAVSGTGQGGEHEAFRDSCPMAYFEPCFRGDFRLRIQGRGYDSGQCGSDPGAYEALVGGCAGACAFRFRSGNAFRAPDCVGAACHGAFAV